MIATIIIVTLALYWLLLETDYMRIQLIYGTPNPCIPSKDTPILLLPEVCQLTNAYRILDKYAGNNRYKEAYQVMTVGTHTLTLLSGHPKLYDIIADIEKAQKDKVRPPVINCCQIPLFIEQVRIGSHHEYVKWDNEANILEISSKPKKGYIHRVVNDYTTNYKDCLVKKSWLKKHEHDLDNYEPPIEVSIDNDSISLNGNYRKGMIEKFMCVHTQKVRAGRKSLTILKTGHVVNMGGGAYIAVNE